MKIVALLSAILGSPAFAGDSGTLTHARLCDPSGCYLALSVVDSDHDGVCDADEQVAGTDPYDPDSRPPLGVVVALAEREALPSFQARIGQFTVFPAEIQAMLEEGPDDPLAAFPLGGRGDGLSRLGISTDLLAEKGIDPERDGVTVTLERGGDREAPPARRVGGVDLRLISADDEEPLSPIDPKAGQHGDVVKQFLCTDGFGLVFEDGSTMLVKDDGSGVMLDKKGNRIGTWYVDPEADPVATEPTPEQEEAWKRIHGAAVRTVSDWSAPGLDGPPEEAPDLIVLLDPQYAENAALLSADPQFDGAQPETDPRLPSPLVPGSPEGSRCVVGCPDPG